MCLLCTVNVSVGSLNLEMTIGAGADERSISAKTSVAAAAMRLRNPPLGRFS